MEQALLINQDDYGLLTDLYQLTMAACYVGEGLDQRRASFELFTRKLPEDLGYLIAMGLTQALEYLNHFRFPEAHLEALRATGLFEHAPESFWQLLAEARFTGDVWAVPEGTAIFANEPLLRIEAPLWQAQIAETYLLNTLNYQTLIATRAARMRDVAGPEAALLEFGTRRAFSPQGSVWAARAALAAGLNATSNVLAAIKLGRKPTGTMAHALVMALTAVEGSEDEAFTAFQRYFPKASLLIDTYDTVDAAKRLAQKVKRGETEVTAVRIDSGDLVNLSKQVRSHLPDTKIFASGDLDEYEIARFKQAGAEIDGYGLGTRLVTGKPVNGVYKLVEIDGIPVMKQSDNKATYPGRKQIFRQVQNGQVVSDRLGLMDELPESNGFGLEQPLLHLVMQNGQVLREPISLDQIAQTTAASVASLPSAVRQIEQPDTLTVEISQPLQRLTAATQHRVSANVLV
ncbi:MAG TPA: nicotinate phosphoribosyltransferase [Trichocoleus sp.]